MSFLYSFIQPPKNVFFLFLKEFFFLISLMGFSGLCVGRDTKEENVFLGV
jgi:hypothetical protein